VFDAVINALLCRMFPAPAYTSFFSDYYCDSKFPECLLRPPANWNPRGKAAVPPGLAGHPSARGVYQALYSEAGADYYELFQALRTGICPKAGDDTHLIGNHAEHAYKPAAGDPLFETVRDIVEKWPQPPNPIAGRSWSALLNKAVARPVRQIGNREILRNLIVRTAPRGSAGRVRRPGYSEREFVQPWPGGDRRSVVLRALGRTPLSHIETAAVPYRAAGVQPVHVYLDVSGSIGDLKGCLYGAVLDCRALVHERVHLFSTRVQDITVQQLRQGVCHTTGGTSIDCVAEHMRGHGVRRAVLLTDGWVGRAAGSAAGVLKSAVLGVALSPGNTSRSDLSPFANHWAELKEPRS